jgi:hypothetical protein
MSECIEVKPVQNGYGTVWVNGKNKRAHRHAWEKANGPIPDGLLVCHRCNNKACVNPDHLYLGTCAENLADAKRDGLMNWPKGEGHWNTTLTEQDVRAIRSDSRVRREIAADYGIHTTSVTKIKNRSRWGHVV